MVHFLRGDGNVVAELAFWVAPCQSQKLRRRLHVHAVGFPIIQTDFWLRVQNCAHSTQFPQYVSACVPLCSQSRMRESFICDTVAALPELIHRCQNQHMLLCYTVTLSKLLSLNAFIRDEGPAQ